MLYIYELTDMKWHQTSNNIYYNQKLKLKTIKIRKENNYSFKYPMFFTLNSCHQSKKNHIIVYQKYSGYLYYIDPGIYNMIFSGM